MESLPCLVNFGSSYPKKAWVNVKFPKRAREWLLGYTMECIHIPDQNSRLHNCGSLQRLIHWKLLTNFERGFRNSLIKASLSFQAIEGCLFSRMSSMFCSQSRIACGSHRMRSSYLPGLYHAASYTRSDLFVEEWLSDSKESPLLSI